MKSKNITEIVDINLDFKEHSKLVKEDILTTFKKIYNFKSMQRAIIEQHLQKGLDSSDMESSLNTLANIMTWSEEYIEWLNK